MTDDEIQRLLEDALPPADAGPDRDLWPAMRARLDQQKLRVSPFDWALIAAVLAWIIAFPKELLVLLYHL